MIRVDFKYRDKYNKPKWSYQSCVVTTVEECKKIYGLGVDCEYEILRVTELGYWNMEKKLKPNSAARLIYPNVQMKYGPEDY